MEDRKDIKPSFWYLRNKIYINYALKGNKTKRHLQNAYDIAMVTMYRQANKELPWKEPPKFLIELLKNYEEKTEEK